VALSSVKSLDTISLSRHTSQDRTLAISRKSSTSIQQRMDNIISDWSIRKREFSTPDSIPPETNSGLMF